MTLDPIRRRFGKGAARLRIGLPASHRLSALARTPIRLERRLTLVPFATAAWIVWLLATSPLLTPQLAEPPADAIQISFETWPVPPSVERPPKADLEPIRERTRKTPEAPATDALAMRDRPGQAARQRPAPAATEDAQAPFDFSKLATRAPTFSRAEILPDPAAPHAAVAALPESRRAQPEPSSAMPAGLAAASRASDRSRTEFLSALEGDAAARSHAASAEPAARRPEVSARRASAPLLAMSSRGAHASSGTAREGWQEVPLDELPDCTPAGRQDLLKKRILLAVPFQQECSHPGGSYRFVETRNLGAFLMWSRPNPGQKSGQPRDRDACDVLERALECIGNRSSQESSSR